MNWIRIRKFLFAALCGGMMLQATGGCDLATLATGVGQALLFQALLGGAGGLLT